METLPALQEHQVESLISQAIDKNVSVETLERLLVMRKELKAEYAKEQYDKDMGAFQAECPIITKTRYVPNNSGGGYKFAPIESIVRQVKPLLAQYNFSYLIKTEYLKDSTGALQGVSVSCIVKHTLGHSEVSTFPTPLLRQTAMMNISQQIAATFTFAKRYAFCNAFGILTGDEDNDSIRVEGVSEAQILELRSLLTATGFTEQGMLEKCSIDTIEAMTANQAETILENLKRILAKRTSNGT